MATSSHFSDRFPDSIRGIQTPGRDEPYRGTYMGQPWPRQPIPVRAGPWVSNTLDLERDGWKVACAYEQQYMTHRIVIGHAQYQAMIMVEDVEMYRRGNIPLQFTGEIVGKAYVDNVFQKSDFKLYNMHEAFQCEHEAMHDLRVITPDELFPQSELADDGLIVLPDQQTVKDALDLILDLQAPRQEEIRSNQKVREHQHAKIVTLEQVA